MVQKSLFAITEIRRFLWVLTRFAHTAAGILAHSSLWNFFRTIRILGCRWATQTFSSLQRFSIEFSSGDWLVHSRTLRCFLQSHSLVALAVCFVSLSFWKTQSRSIFKALTEGRRLLAKISRYMAPSILPSIRYSCPVPFAEKHLQRMMFTPPCITVGMVVLGLYSSCDACKVLLIKQAHPGPSEVCQ